MKFPLISNRHFERFRRETDMPYYFCQKSPHDSGALRETFKKKYVFQKGRRLMNKAPARKLKRLLESRLNTITKYDAAKSDGVFSQNRGFLLLQGRAARNDLRALPALRAGQEGLPAVYSTVYTLTENGKLPSLEQLAAALRAIGCRGIETDYCALFLKTALVCHAAERQSQSFARPY